MIDTISWAVFGSIVPGQRTMPTVRADPSQASPSSPRQGPADATCISSGMVAVVVGQPVEDVRRRAGEALQLYAAALRQGGEQPS